MSLSSSPPNYDSLRRQCRTLESLLDVKLAAFARIASGIGRRQDDVEASGSSERWRDMDAEIQDVLEKLRELNDQMTALSNAPDAVAQSSHVHAIQRHREIVQDYSREAERTRANIQTALDRANLLSGIRNDIEAHKSSAADSLLSERGKIDSSHRMTDDILAQAYETRAEFGRQNTTLTGINARIQSTINTMPGINNVLSMIKTRRIREAIIVGTVIGVCTIGLLSYVSG